MKHTFSLVMLLTLLVTGASAQLKPRGAQEQRDKLIRDYNTIGHADTMAVIYDANCLNADNNKRAQCYTEDMAALRAAIGAVENKKEHPRVAEDGMLIVKLKSSRHDTTGIIGVDYHEGTSVRLTVYDARDNSIVYEQSRGVLLLSNDARQLLTEFLDLWAFLH
jgi:hypothetical protein